MAITLAEYAKINPRTFDTMVRSKIGEATPLLERLRFITVEGSSYKFNKEATIGSVAYRALNGTISASDGTNTEVSLNLAHLSGLVAFDDFFNDALKDDQLNKKIRAMAFQANETFFKGDTGVDALSFDGLETLVDASQEIETGVNGGALSLGLLDEAITGTRGTDIAIFMNDTMFTKFQKAARTQSVAGNVIYAPNTMGQWVMTYNGIPLLKAGETGAGAQVLAFDETQGTENAATSMYLVDFAEGIRGVQKRDMRVKNVETNFGQETSFNWDIALADHETKGITRIKGITNADIVA